MVEKIITYPLTRFKFTLIVTKNFKGLPDKLNQDPEKVMSSDGFVCKDKDMFYMVLRKDTTPGIIAHECKHMVNHIFTDMCQVLDEYNDEFECYTLGWMVDKVHKTIVENKC